MILFGFIPVLNFFAVYFCFVKSLPFRDGFRREAFVLASLIWGGEVVLATEILNLFHGLSLNFVLSFWMLTLGLSLIVYARLPAKDNLAGIFKIEPMSRIEFIMILTIAFIVAMVGIVAWMAPPNSWDAVNYHMSRVMFWKQNHSVDHYPTPEFRQLFFQPWTGFASLHFQILAVSDRFATLVSWFSFAGSVLGVSLIVQLLGGGRKAQILAAFFAATIPTAIIEASGVRVDAVVAFWLVCFVSLILLIDQRKNFIYIFFLGINLGLGALTKGTIYLMASPFIIWLIFILWKRFSWLKGGAGFIVILLIAFLLNAGFFYRNDRLAGDPLGPIAIRHWGLTKDVTGPLVLSNVLRTYAHQLGNAVPLWNKGVVASVEWLHQKMGMDILDDRITISRSPFFVTSTTHEDSVTNFVQTVLITVSLIAGFFLAFKSKNVNMGFFMAAIVAAFVIVCDSIRWSSHLTRYNLATLVLSSAAVGFFFEKYFQAKKFVIYVLIFILAGTSMPYVFHNNLRKIVSAKKQTVFNTSRLQQYFRNDSSLFMPYVNAVGEVAERGCRDVGLYMGFNLWDYPLWVIWEEKFHQKGRLEHVLINSLGPSQYPLGAFNPCALISVYYSEEGIVLGEQRFKKIKDFDKTAVYIPEDGKFYPQPLTPVSFSPL